MEKCSKCHKMVKEDEVIKCPTCNYVYCPECAVSEKNEDKEAVCGFCKTIFKI